ncbi:MAG: alpha-amylase, partial [Micrococcales bacterium]
HLHAGTPSDAVNTSDPAVLAVRREHPIAPVIGLFNVTESPRVVPVGGAHSRGVSMDRMVDALSGQAPERDQAGTALRLPPYGALWLVESG